MSFSKKQLCLVYQKFNYTFVSYDYTLYYGLLNFARDIFSLTEKCLQLFGCGFLPAAGRRVMPVIYDDS